jgi:hypothetical protein
MLRHVSGKRCMIMSSVCCSEEVHSKECVLTLGKGLPRMRNISYISEHVGIHVHM